MRANHPLGNNSLSLKQYLDLDHVEVDSGVRTGATWKGFFRHEKMKRRIVATVARYACLPNILQGSDLIATVSRPAGIHFAQESKNLKIANAPFRKTIIPVHQHWHARYQHDPRNRWLRRVITDLYAKEGARYRERVKY
jgi:DNA-binding transcriptional LysR family regulator